MLSVQEPESWASPRKKSLPLVHSPFHDILTEEGSITWFVRFLGNQLFLLECQNDGWIIGRFSVQQWPVWLNKSVYTFKVFTEQSGGMIGNWLTVAIFRQPGGVISPSSSEYRRVFSGRLVVVKSGQVVPNSSGEWMPDGSILLPSLVHVASFAMMIWLRWTSLISPLG